MADVKKLQWSAEILLKNTVQNFSIIILGATVHTGGCINLMAGRATSWKAATDGARTADCGS